MLTSSITSMEGRRILPCLRCLCWRISRLSEMNSEALLSLCVILLSTILSGSKILSDTPISVVMSSSLLKKHCTVSISCFKTGNSQTTWRCWWVKPQSMIQEFLTQFYKSSKWMNIYKKPLMEDTLTNTWNEYQNTWKRLSPTFISPLWINLMKYQKKKLIKTSRKTASEVMTCLSRKIISSMRKKDYGDTLSIGTVSKNKTPEETNSLNPFKKVTLKTPHKANKLNYKRKEIISWISFTWETLKRRFRKSKLKSQCHYQKQWRRQRWRKNNWQRETCQRI